ILRRPWLGDRSHRLMVLVDDGFERAVRVGALQVARAPQTSGRMPDMNRDLLAPPALHFQNIGNSHADAAQGGGTGLSDLESCWEDGVGAGNRDFVLRGWLEATKGLSDTHDLFKCRCHVP